MTPAVWVSIAGVAMALLCSVFGFVVWLIRLEGRVNTTQALFDQHKEFIEERHRGIESKIDDGFKDLKRAVETLWVHVNTKADK